MIQFAAPTWGKNKPRKWQGAAFAVTKEHFAFDNAQDGLVSAIMGAGKSIYIEELCATAQLERNEVIVVSTSTEDLTRALHNDIGARCQGIKDVGVWYGKRKRAGNVIVTCIPSMTALAEMLHRSERKVAFWIADEAHRTEADRVFEAKQALQPRHSLGLTATPFRAGSFESISLFKVCLYRYGVDAAQADGVVVPMRIVNYDGEQDDLDIATFELIRDSVGPGIVNASTISDAEAYAKYLSQHGIAARAIHSKLKTRDKDAAIESLRSGELRALVHVNLLSEGANFPWLMWMALRREVQSRVRFVQEIGRGLRACTNTHGAQLSVWETLLKNEAVFYDLHDLFGSFSLSYKEALGEPPERPECVAPDIVKPEEYAPRIAQGEPPVAMAFIESAVRALVVACDCAKFYMPRKPIKKAERLKPITALQAAALPSAIRGVEKWAPAGWMACLTTIADRTDCIRHGFAADLLRALTAIRGKKRWPPIDGEQRIASMPADDDTDIPAVRDPDGQLVVDFSELKGGHGTL